MAKGPAKGGVRTVVAVYPDGSVSVPFASYAGLNSGIAVAPLVTDEFRSDADVLFGFGGSERWGRTAPGWLTSDTAEPLLRFCLRAADAYATALADSATV